MLLKAKLLMLVAAFAALSSLSIAQAHSRPIRFDPEPGAVLSSAPARITGWFTNDIRSAEESFIQVLDSSGANVASDQIDLSSDRRQMSVALQSGTGAGRYIVFWSTFDDGDGEVFQGCYAFFVGQAAADDAVASGEALDGGADCPAVNEEEDSHDDTAMTENGASLEIAVSVDGSSATVVMEPTNFTPRAPDGNTEDPNFGHYHIYLDKVPDDVLTGTHSHMGEMSSDSTPMSGDGTPVSGDSSSESKDSMSMDESSGLAENPVMWVENSHTFEDLAPGVHTISVALFHDDHTPLSPPVIASQSFTIGGAGGDDGGIPAWALIVAIAGGLVVGGVGMKLVGSRA